MRVLLVSTYELGHQPLHVASPAARLRAAGHDVVALDLAVEEYDPARVAACDAVAISVPMHTAMRLGVEVARRLRSEHPDKPIAFYGLYAAVGRDPAVGAVADHAFVGEYEPALVTWVRALEGAGSSPPVVVDVGKTEFLVPARDVLPPLDRYARLEVGGEQRIAGYVEASHGCRHRCRHCPVPVIYDGRLRTVAVDVTVADVAQQVEMGARHISFGDPDFLNAPVHARRVIDAVHATFPDLTFDLTVKVSHILEFGYWEELARRNTLFVISAFESTDDRTLRLLDKGHTAADMTRSVEILRREGIEIRPTWLPFVPWTDVGHLRDMFSFIADHDLFGATDPVQMGLRLLLPAGSLLLELEEIGSRIGPYDPDALTHPWTNPDPSVDDLQRRLADLAADGADRGTPVLETLAEQWRAVLEASGEDPGRAVIRHPRPVPRLTESWFCCAEPTELQRDRVGTSGCGC